MDSYAYSVLSQLAFLDSPPFPFSSPDHPFCVLIETASSSEDALDSLIELLSDSLADHVLDSRMSTNETQYNQFWALRENVVNGCLKKGPNLKYDLSLP